MKDFLFTFYSNYMYVLILYRFRNTAGYFSKVEKFSYLACIWCFRWHFTKIVRTRKLESLGCAALFM